MCECRLSQPCFGGDDCDFTKQNEKAGRAKCKTCNGHEILGSPGSVESADHGEACPDCNPINDR